MCEQHSMQVPGRESKTLTQEVTRVFLGEGVLELGLDYLG